MTAIDESTAAGFRGKLCPDLTECEQRCDESVAKACSDLMILYAIGDRVRRDLASPQRWASAPAIWAT